MVMAMSRYGSISTEVEVSTPKLSDGNIVISLVCEVPCGGMQYVDDIQQILVGASSRIRHRVDSENLSSGDDELTIYGE